MSSDCILRQTIWENFSLAATCSEKSDRSQFSEEEGEAKVEEKEEERKKTERISSNLPVCAEVHELM